MLKPKKLQYHSNKGKAKEKEKERGEGKEDKEKKAMVTLLVFIMATLEIVFGRKNFGRKRSVLAVQFFKYI